MKSVEFCYWLQGLFEVGEPTSLNEKQTDLIKRHLNMVFLHEIDPSYPVDQQDKLNNAHSTSLGPTKTHSTSLGPTKTVPNAPVIMRC